MDSLIISVAIVAVLYISFVIKATIDKYIIYKSLRLNIKFEWNRLIYLVMGLLIIELLVILFWMGIKGFIILLTYLIG